MRVILDEATHTYRNEKGQVYTGCSTLVGEFKEKFDREAKAEAYAKKNGETAEYWLAKWDAKRDKACDDGHRFHKEKEEGVGVQAYDIRFGRQYRVRNQALELHTDDLSLLPDGVYLELTLWHHGYRLAGQADKVYIETINGVRYVDIDDYKTNEQIELVSFQFRNGSFKMMKGPVSHLMDCNYFHYELQQSVYAFMLEGYGFVPRSLRLLHHGHTGDGGREIKGKPYDLNYRKREVLGMITHYRKHHK